jgi:hypothetical protein
METAAEILKRYNAGEISRHESINAMDAICENIFTMPLAAFTNRSIYEYALQHLNTHKAEIEAQIANLRRQLGMAAVAPVVSQSQTPSAPSSRKRKTMSDEGKARISAAQKKRWAAFRASQKVNVKASKTSKTTPRT